MSSSPSAQPATGVARCSRALEAEAFREACTLFSSGVAVATVRAQDGTPHGLTVSSFAAVSIQPPLILICIDLRCPFISHFRQGTHFAVNVLGESQRGVSVTFAEKSEGRFEGLDWTPGETGAPLLRRCLAALECRTASIIEAGDHAIFVGEVEHARWEAGRPLVYFNRDYRSLG
ncbi:MAG TPA: flavin reductase family protein [Bryobacteraceae bacterium]|nr:flavin reductase family protein [Bryobacteraceae bacterium]